MKLCLILVTKVDATATLGRIFAVEYTTMAGRLNVHRVAAHGIEDAMQRTVEALGIDFAAIQSVEERGA